MQLIHAEIDENGDYTIDDLMVAPKDNYSGVLKESTIKVNVPVPVPPTPQVMELNVTSNGTYNPTEPYVGYKPVIVNVPTIQNEYLQNKRITSNGDYSIQGLMNNPTLYDGVTKNSNLIIDIPTLDVTQISNYPITTNGTQSIPIPSGYDAVDSISLNVNVPSSSSLVIDNVLWPNSTTKKISTFSKVRTNGNVTFSQGYLCILVDTQPTGYWRLRITLQATQNQQYMYQPGFYASINVGTSYTNSTIDFRDSSNNSIFKFNDPILNDARMGTLSLSKSVFNFDIEF